MVASVYNQLYPTERWTENHRKQSSVTGKYPALRSKRRLERVRVPAPLRYKAGGKVGQSMELSSCAARMKDEARIPRRAGFPPP